MRKLDRTPRRLPSGKRKDIKVRNILFYKLVLLNTLAIAWLSVTQFQSGWFGKLFYSDTTGINYAIAGLFAVVLIGTARKGLEINRAHRDITGDTVYINDWQGELRLKQMEWIEKAAGWMLFLGLIGTLYGLMISLEGVNTGNFGSVEGIKQIAVQMVAGLRIEISTTIIGALFALWTEVNFTVIKHTADYVAALEEEAMIEEKMAMDELEYGDTP